MNIGFTCCLCLVLASEVQTDNAAWLKHSQAGMEALNKGRYREAEEALTRALKVASAFGDKDPRLAESQLALGRAHFKQGRYAEADRLSGKAQAALEKLHGREHPAVARCLNLQAHINFSLGATETALQLAKQAYVIREKKLGKQDLETVESVETLAPWDGAYDEVRTERTHISFGWDVRARTLRVREKLQGKDHPDLAVSLMVLARTHDTSKDDLERALTLLQKAHGDKHPDVAECLTLLAGLYGSQEKFKEMEATQQKALAIWTDLEVEHPRAAPGLYNLALARLWQNQRAEAERLGRDAIHWYFARLSDQDLCRYYNAASFRDQFQHPNELAHAEAYLTEMQRRGGPVITKFLRNKHSELLARQLQKGEHLWRANGNLELLTVLRRLEKKSDPVIVDVKGPGYIEAVFPLLPELDVSLKNVDEGEKSVGFQEGGDYRTGRLERWRIEAQDTQGKFVPLLGHWSDHGGGLYNIAVLKPGKSWPAVLPMNRYVALPPGEYTVRILYHDSLTIASMDWLPGLIVCQSEPIRLLVQPRVVDVTAKERRDLRSALNKLEEKAELKVLDGPILPGMKIDVFPPASAPGQLLAAAWKAVPFLLDELDSKNLTARKRAWVLALLFMITGELNPIDAPGVLPDFYHLPRGWSVRFGNGAGGAGWTEAGTRSSTVDEAKQRDFARCWQPFRDYIVVRERPSSRMEK